MNLFLFLFAGYTLLLFAITWATSRRATADTFYTGNRRSPWMVVAYGMIGASISGVTLLSLPGNVMKENFYYLPMVFGFLAGYVVIACLLLPLYYRLRLTSVYTYLEQRFGKHTYKTGAAFFILSRTLITTLRLFLVMSILHTLVLQQFRIPFWIVAFAFIGLIVLYTLRGGIKTIVWTDTLQTTFMLLAVAVCIVLICREQSWSAGDMWTHLAQSGYARVFDTEPASRTFWVKQFIGGLFVCVAMTGLDQEMMQKNLSCRTLRAAQKNMFTFSGILLLTNILFLALGALLVLYVQQNNIAFTDTDHLFSTVATQHLGTAAGVVFMLGLIACSYPSADGALTSITTSFCIDIMDVEKKQDKTARQKKNLRYTVHCCFAVVFLLLCLFFSVVKNDAVINILYTITSYTYGPLLGFFFFGLLTKLQVRDAAMPLIAILSPLACFALDRATTYFFGFGFGFALLLLNGLLTFCGMWMCRVSKQTINPTALHQFSAG